jgi:hypothetical protein
VAGNVLWAYYVLRMQARPMLTMCIISIFLNGLILVTAITMQKLWEGIAAGGSLHAPRATGLIP